MNHESRGGIRSGWFEAKVCECQKFVGRAIGAQESSEVIGLAATLTRALSNPATAAEDLLLRGLLSQVAAKWGTFLHRMAHANSDSPCAFVPERMLDRFAFGAAGAKRQFVDWSTAYTAEFAQMHAGVIAARRAAKTIRDDYAHRWDIAHLAEMLDVKPGRLSRLFVREYKMEVP